mgnify:CR=1 FL=1
MSTNRYLIENGQDEIAEFLRNFMGNHGESGDDAEAEICDESGSEQGAVEKIVKRIPDQDQRTGRSLAGVAVRTVLQGLEGLSCDGPECA